MRESTNWSRSWRVRLNFLARLKHKFNKKVDKYFVSHYFPDETAADPWSYCAHDVGHHSQFQYHNEASSSNHTSAPNSQYFDATETPEYLQQHQRTSGELQGHLIPPSSCNMGASFLGDAETPMSVSEYDLQAEFSDAMVEVQLESHHLIHLQQDNQRLQQDPSHHLHQNIHLHQQDTNLHSHQYFYTAPSPPPSTTSIYEMSTDTAETADSNMTDTGNSTFTGRGTSTFTGSSYILPPQPVHPRRTAIRKFLTVHDVTRILFEDDADQSTRSKFRVVASIVYAYRKFKALLKRKQSSTPMTTSVISGRSRIRSLHSSRVYQGIKQRKGKWVAEIRVSRMPDKVWLGSFPQEKQAALAYDLGLHHCSVKRNKVFNFRESPLRLGPSQYVGLLAMNKEDRKAAVQTMACEYAMAYGGS